MSEILQATCPGCGLLVLRDDDKHKLSHQLPVCAWFQEKIDEAKARFGSSAVETAELLNTATGESPATPVNVNVEPRGAHDRHAYRDDCPGCQMVLLGPDARPIPKDHPTMVAALKVWWACSFEQRSACQRVWVHNSRVPSDLIAMEGVMLKIQKAMAS